MLVYNFKKGIFRVSERVGKGHLADQSMDMKCDIISKMELLLSPEEVMNFTNVKSSVLLLEPNYLVDLEETEEEIFKKIHRSTKGAIKKALKNEEFLYVELTSPTDEQIEEFSQFYNQFASKKNIEKCNVKKLKAYKNQGALVISYIKSKTNQVLCAHSYFCEGNQAFGMYAPLKDFRKGDSINGQLIGTANRYLYWRDILSCKQKGLEWYNFGGKILNPKDTTGQNINKFKSSFGSINAYNLRIYYSKNFLGKLFVLFMKLNFKLKKTFEYQYALEVLKTQKELYRQSSIKSNYFHKEL